MEKKVDKTMTMVSKSHTFSKQKLLTKLVANAAWIVIERHLGINEPLGICPYLYKRESCDTNKGWVKAF